MPDELEPDHEQTDRDRWEIIRRLEDWLEFPMVILAFIWLILLVVDLVWGLAPFLQAVVTVIWIIFILDFILRFILAPRRGQYLKHNWLTAISLFIPALRIFRITRAFQILRVARTARGARLVRVISSLNRGMSTLGVTLGRRGFGYAIALTLLVTIVGAAGMFAFENLPGDRGLNSYGEALWWTAMIMTTLGSEYWPQTAEGRILGFLLALFALGVFGYLTATLASYFIGQDAEGREATGPAGKSIDSLRKEIAALRDEVRESSRRDMN